MVTPRPSERRERRRHGGGRRGPRRRAADERFNQWLDERLRRLYEAELSDPIPEDMLRLLKRIESDG
ncbi:MAG TPA: NepR family anti-sigma factor [Alphaproteobacteria bacterium]|nr:NepR family anti-sigma factor [Alphaproteobacteria bacterium]